MFQRTITYRSREFFDRPSTYGMIHAFNNTDAVNGVAADNFATDADIKAMLYWLRKGRPSGHDFGWIHVMVSFEERYGFTSPSLYRSYMFDLEQTLLKIAHIQHKALGVFL